MLQKDSATVGLALSGGAVRGAAHIGVLQVLEEAGISPTIVAGTSVGAVIGAGYAAGVSVEEMSRLMGEVGWPTLLGISFNNRYCLFDTSPLEEFIRGKLGVQTFADLPKRFAAIACDILTGRRVVLNEGEVAQAVRASAALPGFFSPVEIGEMLLVDGGLVDNLPAGVVRDLGADYVIAVDLISSTTATGRRPGNPLEMIVMATNLMVSANHPDPGDVDAYIRPDLSAVPGWDFKDVPEIEEEGRAAAEALVEKIREDLHAMG